MRQLDTALSNTLENIENVTWFLQWDQWNNEQEFLVVCALLLNSLFRWIVCSITSKLVSEYVLGHKDGQDGRGRPRYALTILPGKNNAHN